MSQNANEELDELSNTLSKLVCPKCNTSLGIGASKSFDAVKKFNASAAFLDFNINNGTVEIE